MSAPNRPRVLTVGETMALLDPLHDGELRNGMPMQLRFAGAESNFATALVRLGVPVAWASRLGDDPLGALIADTLAAEGVDLRWLRRDAAAPTGAFFKWRIAGRSSVAYYRRGSAASRLAPGDIPEAALDGIELLHLTGITMALSDSSRRLVVELAARAHARGVRVTFDPNYRPALWDGPGAACAVHRELFEHVDWYLCGQEEGHALFGTSDLDELLETQHAAGLRQAVVRVGARGAVVSCQAGRWHVAPRRVEEIVDEIGAGDGYAAGFAYGLLQGWEPPACAHAGNLIAASALRGTGDWETYPRLPEVDDLLREAAAARA